MVQAIDAPLITLNFTPALWSEGLISAVQIVCAIIIICSGASDKQEDTDNLSIYKGHPIFL